jgi:hypothetical protein
MAILQVKWKDEDSWWLPQVSGRNRAVCLAIKLLGGLMRRGRQRRGPISHHADDLSRSRVYCRGGCGGRTKKVEAVPWNQQRRPPSYSSHVACSSRFQGAAASIYWLAVGEEERRLESRAGMHQCDGGLVWCGNDVAMWWGAYVHHRVIFSYMMCRRHRWIKCGL